MVLFLAAALGGAAKRYSQMADEKRLDEKEEARLKEERAFETKKARRDAILDAEKARIEYERKRDLQIQEQRLIQQRELAVQGVKEKGLGERLGKKEEGLSERLKTTEGGKDRRLKERIISEREFKTLAANTQVELAQLALEGKIELAMSEEVLREVLQKQRLKFEGEQRDLDRLNKQNIASTKRTIAAQLRRAEEAKNEYQFISLGESPDEEMEGATEYLLRGSYNSGKRGLTTGENSAQLLAELNKKLEDPSVLAMVTEKMSSDPEMKREVLSLVNTLTTDYYNRTKSVSQNGQVRFNPIFHSPDQPNGVDKKGFGNIAKLPGVRERFWRMVSTDSAVNSSATDEGTVDLEVSNNGTARPVSTATNLDVSSITNDKIRTRLSANTIAAVDISDRTIGQYNSLSEDPSMVVYALQTDPDQNPGDRKQAAINYYNKNFRTGLSETDVAANKAAVLYGFFKNTAFRSRPVAERTKQQNMRAMIETGSASLSRQNDFKLEVTERKTINLGRAKYIGAQNLARTLTKLKELDSAGDVGVGFISEVKSLFEGAFGSTGQLSQAIDLMSKEVTNAGEPIYQIPSAFSDVRTYTGGFNTVDQLNPAGVRAFVKDKLLQLAAYQMAITYQNASDKITDQDVRNFRSMLTVNVGSVEQYNAMIDNFIEDANFQLFKNYGYSASSAGQDYSSTVAAQKLSAFAGEYANESARSAITGSRVGNQARSPARQPTFEQRYTKRIFDTFKPVGDLQSFIPSFLNNVKANVAAQRITGANAQQTENTVGDDSDISIVASRPLENQDAFLIKANVTKNDQVIEHFFKLRTEGSGRGFRYFIEDIVPADISSPQSNAMGGVISSFAKSVAARK